MIMWPCNKSGLRTPKPLRGFGARSLKRYAAKLKSQKNSWQTETVTKSV
jgi:hypothetical protein